MFICLNIFFFGLKMSEGGVMMLFNTENVHRQLMKPWVTCALTHTCISPVGAQDSGCRLVYLFKNLQLQFFYFVF